LTGVIDSAAKIARKFAKTWDGPFSVTEFLAALKKVNLDIVGICSPTERMRR
jgi:predicted dehydrogenase